ncbi:MAG: hypothetical protein KGO02_13010 [Alphaproteobacteria bacterium]|jgi:hypothetical protein|nr:hypothetical protein [Alphaproteobacteria bacterium]
MNPIEHPRMHVVEVKIPEGVAFADLRVARDADGHVSFAVDPLQCICEASGIDMDAVMASEDSAVPSSSGGIARIWPAVTRLN